MLSRVVKKKPKKTLHHTKDIIASWHFNFYSTRKRSLMNACSTNGTKWCLENPRIYTMDMEAMAAIWQQSAGITNLKAL